MARNSRFRLKNRNVSTIINKITYIAYYNVGDFIMNNKGIVIDAGHGGSDSGALGNGIVEKELTLKISKYIADRLKQLGANVTLTRDKDETVDPQDRVKRILNAYGNSKDVLVLSNHINAGGSDISNYEGLNLMNF